MRFLLFLVFVQLWTVRLFAQAQPPKGQIIFSDRAIPSNQLRPRDYLQHYTLTNNSDLFLTANMGRSLLDDLHRVAPGLPNDSLFKRNSAGYQFSLLSTTA
ncbi:hypothetical protein ACQ86N_10425 [Puia sp. P3]|uniref:hypothetical protein n=1 Tax=Puia sp. P3 TaxID=3423952 RepID=UPI003D66625B